MLRASSNAFGYDIDLRAVTDPTIDPDIPHGSLLLAFSEAVIRQRPDVGTLRSELREVLGDEGLVGAAGVIGNFSMMNRIADSVGMPMGKAALARTVEIRALLGLDRLRRE